MLRKLSAIVLPILLASHFAYGQFLFSPTISYSESKIDVNNTSSTSKATAMNLRLGYMISSGFFFGGLYSIEDHESATLDSSDSYFGPSLGFYHEGFLITGTYYVYGEKDLTNGAGKYADVSGFQIDVSYYQPITSSFFIGPHITYQSAEFSDLQVNGTSSDANLKISNIAPALSLLFML